MLSQGISYRYFESTPKRTPVGYPWHEILVRRQVLTNKDIFRVHEGFLDPHPEYWGVFRRLRPHWSAPVTNIDCADITDALSRLLLATTATTNVGSNCCYIIADSSEQRTTIWRAKVHCDQIWSNFDFKLSDVHTIVPVGVTNQHGLHS